MSTWLEHFLEAHQHTIAALGVVGTFTAVSVSLLIALLAQRSSWTRVKAKVGVTYVVQQQLQSPDYITVTITNIGQFPATIPIPFLSWKVPFYSDYLQIVPLDYAQHHPWVRQRSYPIEIKPRASETFFLSDLAGFRTTMAEKLQRIRFLWWRIRFTRAIVLTADGRLFRAKLDKSVRRELAKIPRRAEALDHL